MSSYSQPEAVSSVLSEPGPANAPADGRTPDPLADVRAELTMLRAHVAQNDHEIDDLQLRSAEWRLPWYRNIQSLVAVFALLLSLLTTLVSGYWASTQGEIAERRLRQQEIHDARTELRGLLQSLSELERRIEELPSIDDPLLASRLSSSYGSETAILATQALAIMESIPDQISSSEYLNLAVRFGAINEFGRAQPLIERALATAATSYDFLSAKRTYAALLFQNGDSDGGRRQFAEALASWSTFPSEAATVQTTGDLFTELTWASIESLHGYCDEAKAHIDAAREHVNALNNPAWQLPEQQFAAMAELVTQCEPKAAS
ncbi:MAG: hypothetical protein H0T18_02455 [Chloroflexia bacterium]|nr:hypothetical protein [Chloroflexia bacterium]